MAEITLQQALRRAIQFHQAGNLPEAERVYRQILAANPQQPDALHLLGVIAHQSGQSESAEQLVSRALQLRPQWAEARVNLSLILRKKADGFREAGEFELAVEAYRRAIALKPDSPQAINSFAVALQQQERMDEAVAGYRSAIGLSPGYAEAYSNLAVALREAGELTQAIAAARQAVALAPQNAVAVNNLGLSLKDNGQIDEAIDCHQRAVGIDPNHATAHFNLGIALVGIGELAEAQEQLKQALRIEPANASLDSALVSTLFYLPNVDARVVAAGHFRWGHQHADPLLHAAEPHKSERVLGRRLRIGYVSPDIRQHPVGRFVLPILEHHDRGRFEIFIYSDAVVSDAISARAKSAVEHWINSAKLTYDALAKRIRDDEIDILVDLCGHTTGSRLLMFARNPAAVQVNYLGYPGTTGVSAIDYRLTDFLADPVDMTEALHAEKLYRLPRTSWCFMETERSPEVGSLPLLERGVVTFGSFNNLAKITDDMLELWATILREIPGSRLMVKSMALASTRARSRIARVLSCRGIDPDRLILAGPSANHHDHLAMYNQIDIALDTFPYHGTTTTCDALWMGTAVVTLAGTAHVSRVGVSLLTTLGRAEWIANTREEYVKIAIDLASDATRLAEIRRSLRQQMRESALMDAPGFTRDIETAFEKMWTEKCAGV